MYTYTSIVLFGHPVRIIGGLLNDAEGGHAWHESLSKLLTSAGTLVCYIYCPTTDVSKVLMPLHDSGTFTVHSSLVRRHSMATLRASNPFLLQLFDREHHRCGTFPSMLRHCIAIHSHTTIPCDDGRGNWAWACAWNRSRGRAVTSLLLSGNLMSRAQTDTNII